MAITADPASAAPQTRPLGVAVLDAGSVLAFALLWSWVAVDWVRTQSARLGGGGVEGGEGIEGALAGGLGLALLSGLLLLPLGLLAADLATGCAHWFADRFFAEQTPLIGALLIAPFREHHRDPHAILRHGACEVSGNNCLACLPLLGAAAVGWVPEGAASALLLWLTAAIAVTNLVHRWAHAPRVPAAVGWLQRRGWILGPEQHARHHRDRHDRAYCVTTGWLNPLLDRIDAFGRLERGLRAALPQRRLRRSNRAHQP